MFYCKIRSIRYCNLWLFSQCFGPGACFSKVPNTFRAPIAIRKTPTHLFCKADLFICCKRNKSQTNCKVSWLEASSFWRYKENYVTRNVLKSTGTLDKRLHCQELGWPCEQACFGKLWENAPVCCTCCIGCPPLVNSSVQGGAGDCNIHISCCLAGMIASGSLTWDLAVWHSQTLPSLTLATHVSQLLSKAGSSQNFQVKRRLPGHKVSVYNCPPCKKRWVCFSKLACKNGQETCIRRPFFYDDNPRIEGFCRLPSKMKAEFLS